MKLTTKALIKELELHLARLKRETIPPVEREEHLVLVRDNSRGEAYYIKI